MPSNYPPKNPELDRLNAHLASLPPPTNYDPHRRRDYASLALLVAAAYLIGLLTPLAIVAMR